MEKQLLMVLPRKKVFMSSKQSNSCKSCLKLTEMEKQHHSMISTLSHEIRNPLTLIYSSLQLLEKESPEVAESFLWPQIKEDVQDTIRLLKDISILNRSSTVSSQNIPLYSFLKGLTDSFQALMQERNITFLTYLDPQLLHLPFTGDEIKLKEALMNLLLNAADALDSCRYSGQILLTAVVCDRQLNIHIRDNGPGIPEDYLPTLFDPFVTHKTGGTGLGLSIARNAAISHGGTLTVETSSSGDSYTDFCLTLPLNL